MGLDDEFRDSIAHDNEIFDNLVSVEIWHNEKDALNVDLKKRTINHHITKKKVDGCLFRSFQDRNTSTVTQIREKFRAVQADMLDKIDTVLEVPLIDGLVINEGDQVVLESGRRFQIIAVDYVTLQTRYRLGMQYFV